MKGFAKAPEMKKVKKVKKEEEEEEVGGSKGVDLDGMGGFPLQKIEQVFFFISGECFLFGRWWQFYSLWWDIPNATQFVLRVSTRGEFKKIEGIFFCKHV